ncbi:NADPH-dependent aldehyde reductase-like protein, chloroplastic [Ziziphus jujuba]|uniref:NADPH-dependent aldehyde reductase-like protein, chloroplastic n=1 Tax=Ziziphus jujuba TaxID=326968 RepID=A0A6P4BH79_ZIZJJ|nr:NADPH-dependent aldehyde reductase-like protein, chloroplastic [Ziziphus jujuba]
MATASESNTPQPPLPLKNRVAIVTGGSRGIGKAIALHLASLGAGVVINYTSNSAQADSVAAQINSTTKATPTTAIAVRADVSDADQVKSLFDAAEAHFLSQVHILVNSAGIIDPKYPSIVNTTLQDFDNIFSVNARGAFVCCREAANRLKRGGGGRIILLTTSLVAALKPGYGAYTASKAAVEAMAKILAKELKGTHITVNCVAPGPIATEMFFDGKTEEQIKRVVDESPLCRLGIPDDVAPVVGFLASDAGQWVNGQVVRVNGGYV